jgi:hypothetical protein
MTGNGEIVKARVTGKVLQMVPQKFGSGDREFRFLEASIQTGIASIDIVRFTDSYPQGETPRINDVVDLEVELGAYAGRSGTVVNATAVKPFDESYVLGLFAASAA